MVNYIFYAIGGIITLWGLFFTWFLIVLNKKSQFVKIIISRRLEFISLLIFCFTVFTYYVFVDTNDKSWAYVVIFINMVFILVMDSYYASVDSKYRHAILFLVIVGLGMQAIISIPYLLAPENFKLIRLYSAGELSEGDKMEALKNGVGGNVLYTSLASICIGGYALSFKMKKLFRYITLVSLTCCAVTILISTFLASVLTMLLGIITLIIIGRNPNTKSKWKHLFIFLGLIAGLWWFYESYVADTLLEEPIKRKVEDFGSILTTGGAVDNDNAKIRLQLTAASVRSFVSNPFFGIGVPPWHSYDIIGEHIQWIDLFANFGVIGLFPFLLFLGLLLKKNIPRYFSRAAEYGGSNRFYNRAMLVATSLFIFSSFISPLITEAGSYMMFIFFYTSNDFFFSNRKVKDYEKK